MSSTSMNNNNNNNNDDVPVEDMENHDDVIPEEPTTTTSTSSTQKSNKDDNNNSNHQGDVAVGHDGAGQNDDDANVLTNDRRRARSQDSHSLGPQRPPTPSEILVLSSQVETNIEWNETNIEEEDEDIVVPATPTPDMFVSPISSQPLSQETAV